MAMHLRVSDDNTPWTPEYGYAGPPKAEPQKAPPPAPSFGRGPAPAPKPPRRKAPLLAWVCGLLGVVAVALAAVVFVGSRMAQEVPAIPMGDELWTMQRVPGMTFEDATGQVIATRGARNGYRVRLSELPAYVPRAFLAAEDRRFYEHGPIDVIGILRAAKANITAGRVVQGGSTLTQQMAKRLFLTPERTYTRKFQEAVLAYRLEERLTKHEVLELYLNRVFFGNAAYGLDAASRTYFSKPASELSIGEAALLAAVPQAPSRMALHRDSRPALVRSRQILMIMRQEGWITSEQLAGALASPPVLAPAASGEGDLGYILDAAAAEATRVVGTAAPDLVIRLTVDARLQTAAQQAVREVIGERGKAARASQAAFVALGPSGEIKAMVGGLDHTASSFNRATQARRQPGSSFKVFVYAAALENEVKPTDIRNDEPVEFDNWRPANYGGNYLGPITVETALIKSVNTVAATLANEMGAYRVSETARRFGITTVPAAPNLSIALGAYEVNLLEMTGAFQVFQNQGRRQPPYLVSSIASSRGESLYTHVPIVQNAYRQDLAGVMVRMLMGVVERGTGTGAAIGRPAAGKTGTSQNFRDAWFIGFTPDWVGGAWVGNDDDRPMNQVTGGVLPAQIWKKFMTIAHEDIAVHDFDWAPPILPAEPTEEGEGVEPLTETRARNDFYDDLAADFDAVDGEEIR